LRRSRSGKHSKRSGRAGTEAPSWPELARKLEERGLPTSIFGIDVPVLDLEAETEPVSGNGMLYRPRSPNVIQQRISSATGSPYTHAAIYLGSGLIAESGVPFGVTKSALTDSMQGNQCIAVLRSQLGFGGDRRRKLNEFVAAVLGHRKFYNLIAVASFPKRSAEYFANQLEFVRKNYGEVTSHEEFAKQSFFCYSRNGEIYGMSARVTLALRQRASPPSPTSRCRRR
jgi:hypothetical protein